MFKKAIITSALVLATGPLAAQQYHLVIPTKSLFSGVPSNVDPGHANPVAPLEVTLGDVLLPMAQYNEAYYFDLNSVLQISNDHEEEPATVIWTLVSGSLPQGLSLIDGVITGVPTRVEETSFTVNVVYRDKGDERSYTLPVELRIGLASATLPTGQVGVVYPDFDLKPLLSAPGLYEFDPALATWSLGEGSSLPAGLTLDPDTGIISGTPTEPASHQFTVHVNYDSSEGQQTYTIVVDLKISLNTATLPIGAAGQSYGPYDLRPLLEVYGVPSIDLSEVLWDIDEGSLPDGLELDPETGVISGIPTTAGTSEFEVVAIYKTVEGSQTFSITVNLSIALAAASLPEGTVGQEYGPFDLKPLVSAHGVPDFNPEEVTWSVAAGHALPAGLVLDPQTGVISGVPSEPGAGTVEIVATYQGAQGVQSYPIAIDLIVTLHEATLPIAFVGKEYPAYDMKQLVEVIGMEGFDPNHVTWSLGEGSVLPEGMTLDPSTGILSGTPVAGGASNFQVIATYMGRDGVRTYTLNVEFVVALAAGTVPKGVVGVDYTVDMRPALMSEDPDFNPANVHWEVKPGSTLPPGLSLNPTNGIIYGTPTTTFSGPTIIQATYKNSTGEQQYQFVVLDIDISLQGYRLPNARLGSEWGPYTIQPLLTVEGDPDYAGPEDVTFYTAGGTIPSWMTVTNLGHMGGTVPTNAAVGEVSFSMVADYLGKRSVVGEGEDTSGRYSFRVNPVELAATNVATGLNHSCAVTNYGGVVCWGNNDYGQLGTGDFVQRDTAVEVQGLTSGASRVGVGQAFSCALMTNGQAYCWGLNNMGQLGTATMDYYGDLPVTPFPRRVGSGGGILSGITDLAVGFTHACIVHNGAAKCWGDNTGGALGDNSGYSSAAPVQVVGLTSGVTRVSAGQNFSCAIHNGGAKCWGVNNWAQLGNGTTNNSPTPVNVTNNTSGIAQITSGIGHTCVITTGGAGRCWGNNADGQRGDGSTTTRTGFTAMVSPFTGSVQQLSAGWYHTCGIRGGAAYCWGYNSQGQLGHGDTTSRSSPTVISGFNSGIGHIGAGNLHTCLTRTNNETWCFGNGSLGQLGQESTANSTTPVRVRNSAN